MADFDPDAWLKARREKKAGPPSKEALPAPDPVTMPKNEAADSGGKIGTGLLQGLSRFGLDVETLLKHVPSFQHVEKAIKNIPVVGDAMRDMKRHLGKFADEKSDSPLQKGAKAVGEVAPMLIPIGGPEVAAARLPQVAAKVAPVVRGAAGRWMASPAYQGSKIAAKGWQPGPINRALGKVAPTLEDLASSYPAKGAVQGAITDPEHPGEGAAAGAAAMSLPALMRSSAGKWVGGHAVRHGIGLGAAGLAHKTGIPFGEAAYPALSWLSTPGRALYQGGKAITDQTGRIIGYTPLGGGAGEAARARHDDSEPPPP